MEFGFCDHAYVSDQRWNGTQGLRVAFNQRQVGMVALVAEWVELNAQ